MGYGRVSVLPPSRLQPELPGCCRVEGGGSAGIPSHSPDLPRSASPRGQFWGPSIRVSWANEHHSRGCWIWGRILPPSLCPSFLETFAALSWDRPSWLAASARAPVCAGHYKVLAGGAQPLGPMLTRN